VVFTTGIKIKSYFNILIGPGILLPIDWTKFLYYLGRVKPPSIPLLYMVEQYFIHDPIVPRKRRAGLVYTYWSSSSWYLATCNKLGYAQHRVSQDAPKLLSSSNKHTHTVKGQTKKYYWHGDTNFDASIAGYRCVQYDQLKEEPASPAKSSKNIPATNKLTTVFSNCGTRRTLREFGVFNIFKKHLKVSMQFQ
jgi:hypothetical protein